MIHKIPERFREIDGFKVPIDRNMTKDEIKEFKKRMPEWTQKILAIKQKVRKKWH